MVMKVVIGVLGVAMSIIPLGGLMQYDQALELKARLAQQEPESVFLIQEVGKA
jgi:hypothetical protein